MFIFFFQRLTHGPSGTLIQYKIMITAECDAGAQDRIGIAIESTSAIAFVGLLNAMAIFPADRNLYLHEAKSSARYSPTTFVLTYTIVELGFELLSAFGYAAIVRALSSRTKLIAMLDERRSRYADVGSDLLRIQHDDLGNGQHGRKLRDDICSLDPNRGIDRDVSDGTRSFCLY